MSSQSLSSPVSSSQGSSSRGPASQDPAFQGIGQKLPADRELTAVERALPGETVYYSWLGTIGPRPSILSALSCLLLASVFAHLVFPLPSWWPYGAGVVAGVVNLAMALWQAGSYRVVAVTDSGIHVLRKARWSPTCTHLLGSMPRMPLGPVRGRWCKMSIANAVMWVHRRDQTAIANFDREYRGWFQARLNSADISIPVRSQAY